MIHLSEVGIIIQFGISNSQDMLIEGVSYWVREDRSLLLEGRLDTLFIKIDGNCDKNIVVDLIYKHRLMIFLLGRWRF